MTADVVTIRDVVTAVAEMRAEVLGEMRLLGVRVDARHDSLDERLRRVELEIAAQERDLEQINHLDQEATAIRVLVAKAANLEQINRLDKEVIAIRLLVAKASGAALALSVVGQYVLQRVL